jgi:hypothetical protein
MIKKLMVAMSTVLLTASLAAAQMNTLFLGETLSVYGSFCAEEKYAQQVVDVYENESIEASYEIFSALKSDGKCWGYSIAIDVVPVRVIRQYKLASILALKSSEGGESEVVLLMKGNINWKAAGKKVSNSE